MKHDMKGKERIVMATVLIAAAALSRLLPHPPNFTPIGAMALFGGAILTDKRLAFLIPLAAMIVSDAIVGFHTLTLVVYGCIAVGVWMGFGLRDKIAIGSVALRMLAFSVLFFIVTNFAVWAFGTLYAKTFEGLVTCFVAAVPFFRNELLGNIVFATALFGGVELANRIAMARKAVVSR